MQFPELAHDRTGSGTPIVLIHGIGHRRQAWLPLVDKLAENHEVFCVDLPGFGESPDVPAGVRHDVPGLADHVAACFEMWGLDRPHIAGNSLGGAISLELASRGLVSSATPIAPASFIPFHQLPVAALMLFPMRIGSLLAPKRALGLLCRSRKVRSLIGWPLYMHPERHTAESTYGDALAMKGARGFEKTALRMIGFRFRGTVECPTTIVWGEHDRLLLPSQAERARKVLPHATYVMLRHAGHVPMGDAPEEILAAIEQTVALAEGPVTGAA